MRSPLVLLALAVFALVPFRRATACPVPYEDEPEYFFTTLPAEELPSNGRIILRIGDGLWYEAQWAAEQQEAGELSPVLRLGEEAVPAEVEQLTPTRSAVVFSITPEQPLIEGETYEVGLSFVPDSLSTGETVHNLLVGPPVDGEGPMPPDARMTRVDNSGPVIVPPYPCGGGYDYHEHSATALATLEGDLRGARVHFYAVDEDRREARGGADAVRDAEEGRAEYSWTVSVDPATERDSRCIIAVAEDGAGRLSEPSEIDCREPVFAGCSSAGATSPTAWALVLLPVLGMRLRRG